ncbi:MAG: TldD/PmbA family protein [Candidatus Eremiobacterota bacterium]
MQNRLACIIKKYRQACDYMEIRVEDYENRSIQIRTGDTQIKDSTEMGGNVRVLKKGAWGFASFNDLDLLDDFAEKSIKQTEKAGNTGVMMTSVPSVFELVKIEPVPGKFSLKDRIKLLNSYNEIVLNHNRNLIKNSIVFYNEEFKKKYFITSEETYIEQETLDTGICVAAVATKDNFTQMGSVSRGSSNSFSVCENLEEDVKAACKQAIEHLEAVPVKSGTYSVICDQEVAGVFVHEAFGHNCEGDNYKNEDLEREMAPGRVLGGIILIIYDTGLDKGCRGYVKYDDEGVRSEKTYLVKNGVLSGRLHTRETSALMKEKVTGSARAINYRYPPICRMRHTCIEKGTGTFKDMIKDIKTGIYALKSASGTSNGETFTIIPCFSYMIRNGELAEPVRGVKINGNLFKSLKNIDMIGSDFEIISGLGGCGKKGQFPLPISKGAPHIRIQNVSVGGEV